MQGSAVSPGPCAGKDLSVACRACGCALVDVETAELIDGTPLLRLRCRDCDEHVRDVEPDEYAFYRAPADLSRARQLPLAGPHWWLALLRTTDGSWLPLAAAATLEGAWDALQHGWAQGDVLVTCQRGRLPDVAGDKAGLQLPVVSEVEEDNHNGVCPGGHKTRAGGQTRRVECEVYRVRLENGLRLVDGVEVLCTRCEHVVEVYGQSERSIKRGLVMLRENCPQGERNFYVQEGE